MKFITVINTLALIPKCTLPRENRPLNKAKSYLPKRSRNIIKESMSKCMKMAWRLVAKILDSIPPVGLIIIGRQK